MRHFIRDFNSHLKEVSKKDINGAYLDLKKDKNWIGLYCHLLEMEVLSISIPSPSQSPVPVPVPVA